ncbi:MAG: hypothetical protein R3261_05230, partial [Alphaproteobacteria bacterium]|nr:hypothetical protein [Alphaproteobacteria bacterium]
MARQIGDIQNTHNPTAPDDTGLQLQTLQTQTSEITYIESTNGGAVSLPSQEFVTDARFYQQGSDLYLELPDGQTVIVADYFSVENKPVLNGGPDINLTPELVDAFILPLAPGQVAQTVDGAVGDPIGA